MTGAQHVTAQEVAEVLGKTKRAVQRRAAKETWPHVGMNGRGGKAHKYLISRLPADIQRHIATKKNISPTILPSLCPGAAMAALDAQGRTAQGPRLKAQWSEDTAMSTDVIKDQRVRRIAAIVQEALEVPAGWKKRAWVEAVAVKHDTTFQTIYRYIKRYEQAGLAGLQHRKTNIKGARCWSPEALEWWVGLCLARAHRKVSKESLYGLLKAEAEKQGWNIGGYESALWWIKKKVTPQLLALQRGGSRALDNSLPPVLRNYSDLAPFEMLVGDQHRFDFWVTDDETGEVFRPEGYFWQDLRTRLFYGAAVDKKYDSFLMGLALRMGIRIFGPFTSIYTDHGKPEESRYIMGIMKDMRTLGMAVERTVDLPFASPGADAEEISPLITMPGTHTKAIVRNAKAKMIEGTFNVLEGIMRNRLMLPGYCKRLTASAEEQEIDQKEVARLAAAGKLPTFREFAVRTYQALDHYNKDKSHQGVLREWAWGPKPKQATPMQCLEQCYLGGWRPRKLSQEAVDLIFLPKGVRIVDRGRIRFANELYEHDNLVELHKEKITLRYDPMDSGWLLVFHRGQFVCRAEPAEYSSMKDQGLARRKIEEKRRLRKQYTEQYRALTSAVPDFREYSHIPQIEKAAALIGKEQRAKSREREELFRERTPEELDAEVAALEAQGRKAHGVRRKALPKRPAVFLKELERYQWVVDYEIAGGTLTEEDVIFGAGYEARFTDDQREYWDTVRALGGNQ